MWDVQRPWQPLSTAADDPPRRGVHWPRPSFPSPLQEADELAHQERRAIYPRLMVMHDDVGRVCQCLDVMPDNDGMQSVKGGYASHEQNQGEE